MDKGPRLTPVVPPRARGEAPRLIVCVNVTVAKGISRLGTWILGMVENHDMYPCIAMVFHTYENIELRHLNLSLREKKISANHLLFAFLLLFLNRFFLPLRDIFLCRGTVLILPYSGID